MGAVTDAAKKRSEDLAVWVGAIAAALMIAQQVASKAVRDGFFLTEYSPTSLPYIMLASAFASFLAALLFGRLMGAFSPAAAVPVMFALNGVLFFVEAGFAEALPRIVAAAVYIHVAALGIAMISGFWSVINERFDPYSAKRAVSRVAVGATVGGVVGGALTWAFADIALQLLLTGFGIASGICAALISMVARGMRKERNRRSPQSLFSGVGVLAKHRYPRTIAIVVFCGAMMSGLIDYVFKAEVAELSEKPALVGFFAIFYTVTGIITFLVQAFGSRGALRKLGVVLTVCVFPATAIVLLPFAIAAPGIVTLVALRGGAVVIENSLYRSGYELLYTSIARAQKRIAKVLIDLGCDRLGTAVASGLALAVLSVVSDSATRVLLGSAAVVAAGMVSALIVVRREYVTALAETLRARLQNRDSQADTPHAKVLAGTFVGDARLWDPDETDFELEGKSETASRQALLAQVQARALLRRRDGEPQPQRVVERLPVDVSERYLATPLRQALRSIDDPKCDGWQELVQSAPAMVGQLGDLALSPRESAPVRIRAIQLLAAMPTSRGRDSLLEVIADGELRLRRAAAIGLLQITGTSEGMRPQRKLLLSLAEQELRRPSMTIEPESEFERQSPFLYDSRGRQLATSVEYVFLLLAVLGYGDRLKLALAGITSDDEHQRGTGLEYLDNLLPSSLRDRLLSLARDPERTAAQPIFDQERIDAMARELRSGEIDLTTLRKHYQRARREQYHEAS